MKSKGSAAGEGIVEEGLKAATQIGLVIRELEHRRHPHQIESTTYATRRSQEKDGSYGLTKDALRTQQCANACAIR